AANIISAIYVDRRLSDSLDADALLRQLDALMEDIKHRDLGLAWLLSLALLDGLPARWRRRWHKTRRSRRRCLCSTVLTNLGPVLAASPLPRADRRVMIGNLVVEDVEFLPATRPLQCMSFAASIYAGQMSLALRYDSRVLRLEQAQEVLQFYVRAVRKSI